MCIPGSEWAIEVSDGDGWANSAPPMVTDQYRFFPPSYSYSLPPLLYSLYWLLGADSGYSSSS